MSTISAQEQSLIQQISEIIPATTQATDLGVSRLEKHLERIEKLFTAQEQVLQLRSSEDNKLQTGLNLHSRQVTTSTQQQTQDLTLSAPTSLPDEPHPALLTSEVSCQENSRSLLPEHICRCKITASRAHEATCIYSFREQKGFIYAGSWRFLSLWCRYRIVVQYHQHAVARSFRVCPNINLKLVRESTPAHDIVHHSLRRLGPAARSSMNEARSLLQECLINVRQTFIDRKSCPSELSWLGFTLLDVRALGWTM